MFDHVCDLQRSVVKCDVQTWWGVLVSPWPNKPTRGRESKWTTWVGPIDLPGLELGLFLARCPTLPQRSVQIYSRMKIWFHYRSISTTQWNTKTSNCHIQYRNALYGFEFDLIFYRFLKRDPPCGVHSWYFFLTWRWTCEASECLFLPSRAALDTVAEVLLAG